MPRPVARGRSQHRRSELAVSWAREALAAKNKLAALDARRVEDALEQRLSEFAQVSHADNAAVGIRAGEPC